MSLLVTFVRFDLLQEFYHHQLKLGVSDLPRIFGMTASPIKSKGIQFRENLYLLELPDFFSFSDVEFLSLFLF